VGHDLLGLLGWFTIDGMGSESLGTRENNCGFFFLGKMRNLDRGSEV